MTTQKRARKYTEILFFVPCLKGGYPVENLDLLKQMVLIKQFEGNKYLTKTFFHQTSIRGLILTKTVFLHKVSHILLNHGFQLF